MWSIISIFKQKKAAGEHLEKPFENLERIKEQQFTVPFQILNIRKGGFLVVIEGCYAFVPFNLMPWQYSNRKNWETVLFSLKGIFFDGVICQFDRNVDGTGLDRIIVDATVTPVKEARLVFEEEYVGIVIRKTEYGVFVDIGYHFDWECGSLVGLLHHTKVSDVEAITNCEIGDVISASYLGMTDKGISLEEVKYKRLDEQYVGKSVQVKVYRNAGGYVKYMVEDRFVAEFAVRRAIYGKDRVFMRKAIFMLRDGEIIDCEVIKITKRTLFILKLLPHNDIIKEMEYRVRELRAYIGKAVKIRVVRDEDGNRGFLMNEQYGAIFPLTDSFYGINTEMIVEIFAKLEDGAVIDGVVERVDILTEIFTVKYLYSHNTSYYFGRAFNIDYAKEQGLVFSFKILDLKSHGLVVKVNRYRAYVPLVLMPWKYDMLEKWETILFSLQKSAFYGVVCLVEKSEDGKNVTRFFIDATVAPLNEATLVCDEEYAGIVLQKFEYGVILDIGHHFSWTCGSITGFLHFTKFPDYESFLESRVGDIINVNYWETNEKGIAFIAAGYVDLRVKYTGTTTYATVRKDGDGESAIWVEDKYEAKLPLLSDFYSQDKRLIQKAIRDLPDGASIPCKIIDVKVNRLFILKLSSPDELIHKVQSQAQELESYVGKKVKVRIIRKEEGMTFLVEEKYTGFLPLVSAIYHDNLAIVKRIMESSPDNTVIDCLVQKVNIVNEVFTIIYLYPDHLNDNGTAPESEKVELIQNEKYAGFVFGKTEYGAFVDIGYHFNWKHGSIQGLLHRSRFRDTETFSNCKTGDIISVYFLEENEKGRLFLDAEWVNLQEKYMGKILQVSVVKNKSGVLETKIEDKYTAIFPVTGAIYPDNKNLIKKTIRSLPDKATVTCEIVEVKQDNRLILKLLLQENEQNAIAGTMDTKREEAIEEKTKSPDVNILLQIESVKEQAIPVPFRIVGLDGTEFIAEIAGVYGKASYKNMPWRFDKAEKWSDVFHFLKNTVFFGSIIQVVAGQGKNPSHSMVVEIDKASLNMETPNHKYFIDIIGDMIELQQLSATEILPNHKGKSYVDLWEKYGCKTIEIIFYKKSNGNLNIKIDKKYKAEIPVTTSIYGAEKVAIQKLINSLPNGAMIQCEVLRIAKDNLFRLKILPAEDFNQEVTEA
ncbi:MAG: hypothetical protein LBE91_20680 [Tannerella sp.]|jgi:ribosomal protein S1|nr:hypothetical protein [Tannerella sp.]